MYKTFSTIKMQSWNFAKLDKTMIKYSKIKDVSYIPVMLFVMKLDITIAGSHL